MGWRIAFPRPPAKLRALIILKCLLDSGPIIHHKWPVLRYRFTDGTALQHQDLHRAVGGRRKSHRYIRSHHRHVIGRDDIIRCRYPGLTVDVKQSDRLLSVGSQKSGDSAGLKVGQGPAPSGAVCNTNELI